MAEAVRGQYQALVGTIPTLSATFYDAEGVAHDPGVTTVGITNLDGTVVVAAGTATTTSGTASETRSVTLGAAVTQLTTLHVTWTTATYGAFTLDVEVVGAFLFTIAEARQYGDGALGSSSKYPAAKIERKRAELTAQFTELLGYSPIPRYRKEIRDGDPNVYSGHPGLGGYGGGSWVPITGDYAAWATRPHDYLLLSETYIRALRSVESRAYGETTWTAFDATDLADVVILPWGELVREQRGSWSSGRQNWRVGYEYGRWDQVPGDLRTAALVAARYELPDNALSDRAISQTNEFGSTQFYQSGIGGHLHPVPYVDGVLRTYSEKLAAIG